ncbi:MAG: hypothetical protein LBV40_01115 [Methanomicrobiales archaeon]|jgi:hypothetical protein|nr:hypothetical protein [Methanomicrobiales archaeon]
MIKKMYIVLNILMINMLCLTGFAYADQSVRPSQANYGDNLVKSTVDAFCIGTSTTKHETQWQQTSNPNGSLNSNPLKEGESRTDYTYREMTLAYEGTLNYIKDYSMNGGNVAAGLDNLNINHLIDFEADPTKTGLLHFEEQATMFVAGAAGDPASSPMCTFARSQTGPGAYKGTITVGSQMDVREVSARMGIGSAGISNNSDAPVNLRYTFDATGLATDPDDDLAVGSARVYSNLDMHIYDDTYDLNYTKPNITGHFQDRQEQTVRGLFDLSTTFEYDANT